jgi:hypothetical protein
MVSKVKVQYTKVCQGVPYGTSPAPHRPRSKRVPCTLNWVRTRQTVGSTLPSNPPPLYASPESFRVIFGSEVELFLLQPSLSLRLVIYQEQRHFISVQLGANQNQNRTIDLVTFAGSTQPTNQRPKVGESERDSISSRGLLYSRLLQLALPITCHSCVLFT